MTVTPLIGFPKLFPGKDFFLHTTAFTLPIGEGISVSWYSIFLLISVLAGAVFFAFRTRKTGIAPGDCIDLSVSALGGALIGARLLYILCYFRTYEGFLDYFRITDGKLSLYGGFLGAFIGALVAAKVKKTAHTDCLKLSDAAAPALLLGQCLAGVVMLFSGTIQGIAVPYSYPFALCQGYGSGLEPLCYHPTFLYEAFWCLLGLLLFFLLKVDRKKTFAGELTLLYLGYYGMGRMVIESFRNDRMMLGSFPLSQILAFLSFVGCGVYLILYCSKRRRKTLDAEEYVSVYERSAMRNRPSAIGNRQAVQEADDAIEAIIKHAGSKQDNVPDNDEE